VTDNKYCKCASDSESACTVHRKTGNAKPELRIKRPYPRSVPCAVRCRADGSAIYACIGDETDALTEGKNSVIGFGDTLPEALRALADELEREVGEEPIISRVRADASKQPFGDTSN